MTIEVSPVGVKCNLSCSYCYEDPMRLAGNFGPRYDLPAILKSLEESNQEFTLFGGEPLLMRIEDLEVLLSYGFEKFKSTNIQTNATLVTQAHADLFRRYNTSVGVSIDGILGLNDARGKTDESIAGVNILLENHVPISLIVTLHKLNATGERLNILKEWFENLGVLPIQHVRLHLMEDDGDFRGIKLTTEEQTTALLELLELQKKLKLRFDLFYEMKEMLEGREQNASCIWRGCDPYTTPAVHNIDGDGTVSNCGRTNKDGVNFRKADTEGNERQIILYNTPQEYFGCKDCRFFLACRGECPGTGEENDWRNRTTHCDSLKELFSVLEKECVDPISLRPNRKELEEAYIGRLGETGSENWHQDVPHEDITFLGILEVR